MGFALSVTAKGPSANSSDLSWTLQPCKCLSAWEKRQGLSLNDRVHLICDSSVFATSTSRVYGQGKKMRCVG